MEMGACPWCLYSADKVVPVKLSAWESSDVGAVGKDTNILGQLANIGRRELEANRCQYLEQDVWTFWEQKSLPSAHFQEGFVIFFLA